MKIFLLIIAHCLFSLSVLAQKKKDVILREIADEVLTHSTAYENLRILCKQAGPRLSGSATASKAIQLTSRMMKEAGADTVYLQPCMVTHWERGKPEKGNITINGKSYPLKLTALGNSIATGNNGIRAEIVEVASMDELKKLGNTVKGKIVFFNIPMDPTYVETFRAYGESGIGRRSGPSAAAAQGAIGVIVRSLATNPDDHPHTGATVYKPANPKIPAVAISTNTSNWLSKELAKGSKAIGYFKTNCRMFADTHSYNVIGEIKGSKFPEDIITVGGHLDSWDLAEGANDDGSGCVQSIDVLRTIKGMGIKPARTIRAVLFMNEENGGGGGKAYYDSAVSKKENHLLALESDAGGFTPRFINIEGKDEHLAYFKEWEPFFSKYGIQAIRAGGSGSDIEPLAPLGTVLVGYGPDSQRYFDIHHAETDVFENVSKRELEMGIVNMCAFLYLVSEFGINEK